MKVKSVHDLILGGLLIAAAVELVVLPILKVVFSR